MLSGPDPCVCLAHRDEGFMEERRGGLRRFLGACLAHPQLGSDALLTAFLQEMDGVSWKLAAGDAIQREQEAVTPPEVWEVHSLEDIAQRMSSLREAEEAAREEREWIKQTRLGLQQLVGGVGGLIGAFGQLGASKGRSLAAVEEAVAWIQEPGELGSCAHRLAQTCNLLAALQRQLSGELGHRLGQPLLLLQGLLVGALEMLDRHRHILFNDFDSLLRHLVGLQAQLERNSLHGSGSGGGMEGDHLRLSLHRSLAIYQHHVARNQAAHERVAADLAWLHTQWQLLLTSLLSDCATIMEQHAREQHQQWSRLLMLIAPQ